MKSAPWWYIKVTAVCLERCSTTSPEQSFFELNFVWHPTWTLYWQFETKALCLSFKFIICGILLYHGIVWPEAYLRLSLWHFDLVVFDNSTKTGSDYRRSSDRKIVSGSTTVRLGLGNVCRIGEISSSPKTSLYNDWPVSGWTITLYDSKRIHT